MKIRKVREGKIRISIPDLVEKKISKGMPIFYNSEGELNRDISICALQTFQKEFGKTMTVCDALSASGIRGTRYAKEVSGIRKVVLNDKNPSAVKLIKRNVKLNSLGKKCTVANEDASLLLRKNVFVAIDIDPFGSPCTFVDSAARSVYHRGFLAVTATDQSALAGTYPESCLRKYGIRTVKTEFYNELGVRILVSFIILALSRYDRAFVPVLSFADQHYYRVFGRIEHAGRISELLKQFKYISYCDCGNRKTGSGGKCQCGKDFHLIGPIYLGSILDRKFCEDVLTDIRKRGFRMGRDEEKLLNLLIGESGMSALYFDLHHMSKVLKKPLQRMDRLIERLEGKGFKASRTHFSPTAIKTDADYESISSL